MNLKQYLPESSTLLPLLLLLLFAYWYGTHWQTDLETERDQVAPAEFSAEQQIRLLGRAKIEVDGQLESLQLSDTTLQQTIKKLLADKQFNRARTLLLELAAQAAEQENDGQLANILLLLGSVSIGEQALDSAELLLQEALDIAIAQNDTMTMARSYQQLGRLNIKARALARYASEAYDQLWITRRQIFSGDYRYAETNLGQVIEANLQIKRYGAAASAYETLADFHRRFHDDHPAEQADIEAARLYASSGQLERSRRVAQRLADHGMAQASINQLNRDIEKLFAQYQGDSRQFSQAQDLQMLYHHYLDKGDHRRAWQLRIKSSRSLDNSGGQSVFQRQPDVLAILYSSNFAMDRARQYLQQAGELFADSGAQQHLLETTDMQALIY